MSSAFLILLQDVFMDATFSGIRAVAFDCDGVMFDSARVNRMYYNTLLATFHLPPMSDAEFRYVHMHTVEQALWHLFSEKVDLASVEKARQAIRYADLLPHMEIEPDLRGLLHDLKPRYHTAIATNRSDTMHPLLECFSLTPLFDMVVTALDVSRPKPWPDQLEKILARFAIPPEALLYIGDSELDEKAAAACGCPFIAFGNPALTATVHVDHLGAVAPLLGLTAPY